MSETVILAVYFQLKQLKKQPEKKKNSGLNFKPEFFQVAFSTAYIESTLRGSQFHLKKYFCE